jgi:hypothetical protein
MHAFHQRLAELWTLRKVRAWTIEEEREFEMCLDANSNFAWNRIRLENMSLLASMTKDYDWLHEICRDIERLQPKY